MLCEILRDPSGLRAPFTATSVSQGGRDARSLRRRMDAQRGPIGLRSEPQADASEDDVGTRCRWQLPAACGGDERDGNAVQRKAAATVPEWQRVPGRESARPDVRHDAPEP